MFKIPEDHQFFVSTDTFQLSFALQLYDAFLIHDDFLLKVLVIHQLLFYQ